ncbi:MULTISPECIES: hypothetical protein [Fischerella]|nr:MULTISPECIES: hypothetical protein [Fischerella]
MVKDRSFGASHSPQFPQQRDRHPHNFPNNAIALPNKPLKTKR